jgi:hypothetical protein
LLQANRNIDPARFLAAPADRLPEALAVLKNPPRQLLREAA